jgi:hypothetical protein
LFFDLITIFITFTLLKILKIEGSFLKLHNYCIGFLVEDRHKARHDLDLPSCCCEADIDHLL